MFQREPAHETRSRTAKLSHGIVIRAVQEAGFDEVRCGDVQKAHGFQTRESETVFLNRDNREIEKTKTEIII